VNALTKIQIKTLAFIVASINLSGKSPVMREIAISINRKSITYVQRILIALEKKSKIKRENGKHRGITLLNPIEKP